jgi:glycopeptide antibiotics resistance protein
MVPPPRRWHFLLCACAWTAFAIYGSLVPLAYHSLSVADALEKFRRMQALSLGIGARADLATNVLLFIPLTFAWMGVLTLDSGRWARLTWAVGLMPLAFTLSTAIELSQIWFAVRTPSWNDVFGQAIGSAIGIGAWLLGGRRLTRWLRRYYAGARSPRSTLQWVVESYLLLFVMWAVVPLDLTLSVTELYHKYERGQITLVPFAYSYEQPVDVAYQFFADVTTFVPVGVWVVLGNLALVRGIASPVIRGVVGGAIFAIFVEIAQLLVLSRYTDTTDILLGAAGAGGGAWLMSRFGGQPGETAARKSAAPVAAVAGRLLVVGAYTLFLAVGFWYPFEGTQDRDLIRARYQTFFEVPMTALYWGSPFNALRQVLVRLLLFAGLGALIGRLAWAFTSGGTRIAVAVLGLAYAAAVAAALEVAQILMPSKIASATEIVICVAGAVIGLAITRRLMPGAGVGPRGTSVAAAPRSSGTRHSR